MTAHELTLLVAEHLAADTGLQAWCTETFGQGLCVFVGIDEGNPPAPAYWPLVALLHTSELKGDDEKYQRFGMDLGSGVVNDAIAVSGLRHTYTGMLQAEELRTRVEAVLFKSNLTQQIKTVGDSAQASLHPYYISYSAVSFSLLKSSRHPVR